MMLPRAPVSLVMVYTFDPVQWVGPCKRNQSDPTKHAPTMMLASPPLSVRWPGCVTHPDASVTTNTVHMQQHATMCRTCAQATGT
eukprot:6293402-Prymnesium_polylepis.1